MLNDCHLAKGKKSFIHCDIIFWIITKSPVEYCLEKVRLEYFKKILSEKLEKLQDKSSQNRVTTLAESEQISDFTDQATLESDIDMNIHIKERDSKLISKIKEALARIQDATYDICDECEEEISEACRYNCRR